MIQLEIGGTRHSVAPGETLVGSGAECAISLSGEEVRPRHLVLRGLDDGSVAAQAAAPDADTTINGVRLGSDPTPLLHGDKVQVGPHELLVVDTRRIGNTQLFDGAKLAAAAMAAAPAAVAGSGQTGRLVSLTDGREYALGSDPVVIGRDASCDVVVPGNDVSRRHAEISASPAGYVVIDTSANGTLVNGQAVVGPRPLMRGDVIRVGGEEFRFYADAPAVEAPAVTPVVEPPPVAPEGALHRLADTHFGIAGVPRASAPGVAAPAESAPVLASLLVRSGDLKGTRLKVRAPIANIGRAEYNDVILPEPSVSTNHAKLQRHDGIWVLIDVGSTNGTLVDGQPAEGEMALSPGSTIKLGDISLMFEPADEAPARPAPDTHAMERINPDAGPGDRAIRSRRTPPAPEPAASGGSGWLVFVLILAAAAAAYLLLS